MFICLSIISVKQYSDKKPLEGHDKKFYVWDARLPMEFMNEKLNDSILRNDEFQSKHD